MVVQANGSRRFTVPVKIGETVIETGLDTGSVGLRVLPGTLKPNDAQLSDRPSNMRYGSGAMYDGVVAQAKIDIAGLAGQSTFQQIKDVGCIARRPDCPASKISAAEYGIMGNGIAGAGFKAILGVAAVTRDVDNPLRQVGVMRFIVELPRSKDETGRVILNPSQDELVGFTAIPAYKRIPAQRALSDDAVNGCLVAETAKAKICGAVTFDTGALGITVASPEDFGPAWPQGTKARMLLDDGSGKSLMTDDLVIGAREDAAHLAFRQVEFMPKTVIRMGIGPYFTYSVLYDLEHGGLGVRPRKPPG